MLYKLVLVCCIFVSFAAALPAPVKSLCKKEDVNCNEEEARIQASKALYSENLYDGDIITKGGRNAIPNDSGLWPGGVIPFRIDGSLNAQRGLILQSMNDISRDTNNCVTFVERTTQSDYVNFVHQGGCSSWIGWIRRGAQDLTLGDGCHYIGTVIHEILHAVGFHHEHKRDDRDDYVNINWENIIPGMAFNFDKLLPHENRRWDSFDYESIMIYGETAFTVDWNLRTIYDRTGQHTLRNAYDKDRMTPSDIYRVKRLYGCPV